MSLSALLSPLLAGAAPPSLRQFASALEREAAMLRAKAAELERIERERARRRQRQADRRAALDLVREAARTGTAGRETIEAAARRFGLDPAALAAAARVDRRRWTAAERDQRNAAIARLAAAGYGNPEIARLVGLSVRQVGTIVRRAIDQRQALQPGAVARRFRPPATP